jgi:membrane protein DedA with SNARE-associated domain
LWNGVLIGLGALLGAQYHLVDQYARFLNYAVYAALAFMVAGLVIRRVRRRKS